MWGICNTGKGEKGECHEYGLAQHETGIRLGLHKSLLSPPPLRFPSPSIKIMHVIKPHIELKSVHIELFMNTLVMLLVKTL